jgi:hypothetical protein
VISSRCGPKRTKSLHAVGVGAGKDLGAIGDKGNACRRRKKQHRRDKSKKLFNVLAPVLKKYLTQVPVVRPFLT